MQTLRCLTLLLFLLSATSSFAQVWSAGGFTEEIRRIGISPDSTVVVAVAGTQLLALNAADGNVRWRTSVDDYGAQRVGRRGFVGAYAYIVPQNGMVTAVTLADGKLHEVAKDFKGNVDTVYDQVMTLTADDDLLVVNTKTLKECFRKKEIDLYWYDKPSTTLFVVAEHELTVINTHTATANTYTIEPEKTYRRAREKAFNAGGMVTLVAEDGFYTYDVKTGVKKSHIARPLGELKNYVLDTISSAPYLLVSTDNGHEVFDLTNGKRIEITAQQLPGVADRFFGTETGLAFAATFDDDDSLHIGCIDVKSGTLRWAQTVGWGKQSYYADPLRYPSGFTAFMLGRNRGVSAQQEMQRQMDMRAMIYNKSTGMMEPDYHKQMLASASGAMDRRIARTMQLLTDEARRPIPDLAKGISQHLAYADVNLVSCDDKQATLLIYGGIFRPSAERADYPDGEGLVSFDLTTGTSTFKHIPIYGNTSTAGDFNADHISDVRDMGNGHFCAFGDTAIIYISMKAASRVSFKTKKVAMYKGTLDSMWVVDTDPETDVISYVTLVYDRATGKTTQRLMAQSDIPCFNVDGWPTSNVAFSFIENTLKIYASAPVNTLSFEGATVSVDVPADTIEAHGYSELSDEEESRAGLGVHVHNDLLFLVGKDATGIFPTSGPLCSTVIESSEDIDIKRPTFHRLSNSMMRETTEKLRFFTAASSCNVTQTPAISTDSDHKTYQLGGGVLVVDNDAKTISLFR